MAKAFLIGGTPRVGKTTLVLSLIEQKPMLASSTDAIRYTLRQVINPMESPELFKIDSVKWDSDEARRSLNDETQEAILRQNAESEVVWKSVINFINSNLEDGFDIAIEGIAVLPKLVSHLDCEYNAVFLGNKSETHFRRILESARANPNDWMHNLSDETIHAFSVFNIAFSEQIEIEANKYGMKYIEVEDANFERSMSSALQQLLNT